MGSGYSPFGFRDRVEAAARAGFTGMGLWHDDLDHILEHQTLGEMKRILGDNGIRNIEVEFLTDWFLDGEPKKQSDIRKKKLFEAAEILQAKQVKVGDFYQRECAMSQLTDSFAALCKEAGDYGTRIAYEPMSVSVVHTLEEVLAMLEGAGVSNGGIILDLWHVINLGIPYEKVSRFPAHYLYGAEICDGIYRISEGKREPLVNRTFCGEGEFDIEGFIAAIAKTGYEGPWGVEIFSEELLNTPLEELATKSYGTAARFI